MRFIEWYKKNFGELSFYLISTGIIAYLIAEIWEMLFL